ncbi:MAG: helix-turn-helix domain-containing protein [Nanoarchaeota archaeon]
MGTSHFTRAIEITDRLMDEPSLTEDSVIDVVAGMANLRAEDLTGRARPERIFPYRFVAQLLLRERFDLSYEEIGIKFDRDRTSVMNGIEQLTDQIALVHKERVEMTKISHVRSVKDLPQNNLVKFK